MSNGRMGNDEGRWSYMARIWCENHIPPYAGSVENKTPGIVELHALSYLLFGVNFLYLRVLGALAILCTSFIVYRLGTGFHSPVAGLFSMVILGFSLTWHQLNGAYTAQTESFMIFFTTLSFYLLIKGMEHRRWGWRLLLSGFSMGFAIAFKQIAITTSLALFILFVVLSLPGAGRKKVFPGILLLWFGILMATLISIIPLILSGVTIEEYFEGAWLILLKPGSSVPFMWRVQHFCRIWFGSRMLSFYPFLLLLFLNKEHVRKKYFVSLLIWMSLDFIGVNASGYYFGHQIKQLLPSLSLISGILLAVFLTTRRKEVPWSAGSLRKTLLLLTLFLFPYGTLDENIERSRTIERDPHRQIGEWLESHTGKEEYIYIEGTGGNTILSYSERVSSSRYFNSTFVTGEAEKQSLMSDLLRNKPRYYLRQQSFEGLGEEFDAYLDENFSLLRTQTGYEIFEGH